MKTLHKFLRRIDDIDAALNVRLCCGDKISRSGLPLLGIFSLGNGYCFLSAVLLAAIHIHLFENN